MMGGWVAFREAICCLGLISSLPSIVIGLLAVYPILELHVLEAFADGDSNLSRTDGEAMSNVAFANRKKFLRVGLPPTSRAFPHRPSVTVVFCPPDLSSQVGSHIVKNAVLCFVR